MRSVKIIGPPAFAKVVFPSGIFLESVRTNKRCVSSVVHFGTTLVIRIFCLMLFKLKLFLSQVILYTEFLHFSPSTISWLPTGMWFVALFPGVAFVAIQWDQSKVPRKARSNHIPAFMTFEVRILWLSLGPGANVAWAETNTVTSMIMVYNNYLMYWP